MGGTDMQDFEHFVIERFAGLANKFRKKHAQYKGSDADELANFSVGARLKYGKSGLPEMYEMAKDYCRKHIAYAVIMLYMRYRFNKEKEAVAKKD